MDYVVELSARTGLHLNFMAGNLYWFNIGALTIRIGFRLLDSILIIRNPKIILVMIIQASIVQNFLASGHSGSGVPKERCWFILQKKAHSVSAHISHMGNIYGWTPPLGGSWDSVSQVSSTSIGLICIHKVSCPNNNPKLLSPMIP